MINSYARISWMSLWSDCHTQIKFQHWRQCFSIRWSHVNHKPANIKGCTNYEWPHQYGWCYGYDFGGPRQFGGWIFDSMEADIDRKRCNGHMPGRNWTWYQYIETNNYTFVKRRVGCGRPHDHKRSCQDEPGLDLNLRVEARIVQHFKCMSCMLCQSGAVVEIHTQKMSSWRVSCQICRSFGTVIWPIKMARSLNRNKVMASIEAVILYMPS